MDQLIPARRSRNMPTVSFKGVGHEVVARKLIFSHLCRYRLHNDLPTNLLWLQGQDQD